jgi:hypothetical protein
MLALALADNAFENKFTSLAQICIQPYRSKHDRSHPSEVGQRVGERAQL